MADATSYDLNDYTHSMHKQPSSSSKPTNLDEEIIDNKEPSSQDIVHEGDTPEESGAPDTPPIELDQLKEELNTTDMSASDMTMNQNEATFLCQNTPASINDEESNSRIVNGETNRKLEETEEMTNSEELKTEPESEITVESVIKMEPESNDESENPTSETKTKPEIETTTEAETKTENQSKTTMKSDSETKTEPEIETTTEAESETKTETQSETKIKAESEVNNKAQPEPGTGSSVPKTDSNVIINGDSLNDRDSGISLSNSVTKPGAPHEWIDVLGNGNLLKRVLREGEGVSTRPTALCQVRMKVRGSLQSGGVVDHHSSIEFTIGDGDVIQALDIVAPLMEKGETCQIKADHRYAFGAVGRSPDIPPQSTLLYDLELISIKGPVDYTTVTEQELLNHLNKKRGRGNDLFQRKEFSLAVHSYSRAVSMMSQYKEEQSLPEFPLEISDLWVRCLNNLAAAQLKVEMFNEALDSVNKVLETDPENVKALYRCGKVHMVKGDFDEAVTYLQKASNIDPEEKAINGELQKAIRKRDQNREQEKAMYKRMMTGGTSTTSANSSSHISPKPYAPGGSMTPSHSNSWNWKYIFLGAGLVAIAAVGIGYLGFKYRK